MHPTRKRCSATLRSPLSMMYSSALCRKLDRIQAALCCARELRHIARHGHLCFSQGTDLSAAPAGMLIEALYIWLSPGESWSCSKMLSTQSIWCALHSHTSTAAMS